MGAIIVIWLGCAVIGALIGNSKGRAGLGLFLGLLLGIIGVIIIAVVKGNPYAGISVKPVGPAGWYDDPLGKWQGRYWDGQAWTKFVGRTNPDGTRSTFEEQV